MLEGTLKLSRGKYCILVIDVKSHNTYFCKKIIEEKMQRFIKFFFS